MRMTVTKDHAILLVEQHRLRYTKWYGRQIREWQEAMAEHKAEEAGSGLVLSTPPRKPISYLKAYDDMLSMLRFSGFADGEVVELDTADLTKIVLDVWAWSDNGWPSDFVGTQAIG